MENTVSLADSNECFMVIAAISCIHFYLLLLTPVLSFTFVRAPESIPSIGIVARSRELLLHSSPNLNPYISVQQHISGSAMLNERFPVVL